MRADAREGEISSVLVWRLDRAFRSMADAASTLAELKSLGVKFRSATEGFETSTAAGEMMFNLLAAFAQFEHRVISERIKADQARVRKHGTRSGRPIGWPKGRKRKP